MTDMSKRFFRVISAIVLLIALGWLVEWLLSVRSGVLFGHSQSGHIVGWMGFAFTMMVFGYSVKKRQPNQSAWPAGWFWLHQVAGVIGPFLIVIHAGVHFHAWVPILALLAMLIVTASGVVGVAVHRKAVGLLKNQRQKLLAEGLSPQAVEDTLFALAAEEKSFRVWQMIHVPMVSLFLVLATAHILGAFYFGGL